MVIHVYVKFYRDYEDIRCEEADQVILQRVQAGEELNLPNGKLLERLLTIKIYRESKQTLTYCVLEDSSTAICWTSPFVILGVSSVLCHFNAIFGWKILLAKQCRP